MDIHEARSFAQQWVADWNRHDLDAIAAHYHRGAELVSPLAIARMGLEEGRLTGRAALRTYFEQGLARATQLHFELIAVACGVGGSVSLVYRRETGATVIEVLDIEAGLIRRARVHYDRNLPAGS